MNKGVRLNGFDDITRILDALPKALGNKTVRECLRKGVKPYIKKAKENASNADNTGGLTKSIGILANQEGNGITVGTRRGRAFKKGYVAHIVEYGAAPHIIKPKKGKVLKFNGGFVTGGVNHPGMQQQPFLRPAWDETGKQVEADIRKSLREVLDSNFKGVFK